MRSHALAFSSRLFFSRTEVPGRKEYKPRAAPTFGSDFRAIFIEGAMLILGFWLVLTTSAWAQGASEVQHQCGRSRLYESKPVLSPYKISTGVEPTEAREAEFPWQVSIQKKRKKNHYCGGSIIEPDVILTAAYCVDGHSAASISVQAGILDFDNPSNYSQRRSVKRYVKHESYGSDNDIALLFLDEPFNLQASYGHIGTVCLPSGEFIPEGLVTVTGWNTVFADDPSSSKLLAATVPVQDNGLCGIIGGATFFNSTIMFCAGMGGKKRCLGDSGGPAVQRKDGVSTLISVLSFGWGYGCIAGFFPKLSWYMPWIANETSRMHDH